MYVYCCCLCAYPLPYKKLEGGAVEQLQPLQDKGTPGVRMMQTALILFWLWHALTTPGRNAW